MVGTDMQIQMNPILKRALIKVSPDYFSLDEKKQIKYRMNISDDDRFKIEQYLFNKLFDISVGTEDELSNAFHELTEAQTTQFNATILPLMGIGEDCFYLNEFFADGVDISHFNTLYDYDYNDFIFQESEREKVFKNYTTKIYRGSLHLRWARLMIENTFTYATLDMAASYIFNELEECGYDYIDQLIPHKYRDGDHHGKKEGESFVLDFKVDANGREQQLDELKDRFHAYINNRYDELLDEFDQQSKQCVFIVNESKPNDPMHNFVFSDKAVLQKIQFKRFLRDCRENEEADQASLFKFVESEISNLKTYLEKEYQDIMKNFDPNVVKFKKKTKVLIHKDAGLDDLF